MNKALLALVVSSVAVIGTARAQNDIVRTRDGQTHAGRIKSEEYAAVAIDITAPKKPVTVAWKDVDSIAYGDAEDVESASKALQDGDLERAVTELKAQVALEKKLRPVLRQRMLFELASALFRTGNAEEATATADKLRAEFPGGRHAADIVRVVVEASLAKQDGASALAFVEKASREGKGAGLPAAFDGEMKLLSARVNEGTGKADKALAEYNALAAASGTDPSIIAEAQLGAARVNQAAGKVDDAERAYRSIVKQDVSARVLAAAWNGLGALQLEKGKKQRSADLLLESVYDYLRGVVQYNPGPGEASDEFEKSLAGAATAFQFLADIESDEANKALNRQRSNEHKAELKKLFPNSKHL